MNSANDKPNVPDTGCLEAIEAMYAWLDGELDDNASITRLEHHLSHCRSCFSRAEMEKALTRRIRESARNPTPETLHARLRKLLDEF